MDDTPKEKAAKILEGTRKLISDASGDDADDLFYINRFVFARLMGTEQATKRKIKIQLFEQNPTCHFCKEKFPELKGVHIHRLDSDRGYFFENCILAHKPCHEKFHRESRRKMKYPQSKRQGVSKLEYTDAYVSIDGEDELLAYLREGLFDEIAGIEEKYNPTTPYYGYRISSGSDVLYIYTQNKKLVIDIRQKPGEKKILEEEGFNVSMRQNHQGRTGQWITGWDIPYDVGIIKKEFILEFILNAMNQE